MSVISTAFAGWRARDFGDIWSCKSSSTPNAKMAIIFQRPDLTDTGDDMRGLRRVGAAIHMEETMHSAIRFLIGTLVLAAAACGPVYQTDYQFRPPRSGEGKACVYQCENGRFQCKQIEDMRAERCQDRAREEQRDCEARIYWEKGRSPKWYECSSSSCSADYEQCEHSYRSCYQSCGGDVTATTRCVSGCEQAPPEYRGR